MRDGRTVYGPLTEAEVIAGILDGRFGAAARCRRVGRKRWEPPDAFAPFRSAVSQRARAVLAEMTKAASADEPPKELVDNPPVRPKARSRRGDRSVPRSTTPSFFSGLVSWLRRIPREVITVAWVLLAFGVVVKCVSDWWDNLGRERDEQALIELDRREQESQRAKERELQRQRAEDEKEREKAALAAAEAARPPKERAEIALRVLEPTGDMHGSVCRAHELLDPIPEADRKLPDVRKALAALRVQKALQLQREQAEFEKTRGLICRDGWTGSSCRCNGPRRGCCSHHGGIAGCEPLPTKVQCP